jgi:diguanylate cyclase (GGDEF)-like protein
MFDADSRLAVCNDRYLEMHGLKSGHVHAGMTLDELFAARLANGSASEETLRIIRSATVTARTLKQSTALTTELPDGRMLAIRIQPEPGGGWVATIDDVTEGHRNSAKILHMARHDALTELPNRIVLSERLNMALSLCARGQTFALHFIDLDHFKIVNDTLGHAIGDKLLKVVGARLQACMPASDTVVRLGGDEFAILQFGLEKPEDAVAFARRVIALFGDPIEIDGSMINVGVSIGVALAPDDGTSAEQLLRNADLALYRAKELGRGDYHFFEPALDERMQKRRGLEDDLRHALKFGQLDLHYQPLIGAKTLRPRGMEALLRWTHPLRGPISPADFIPLAEETGLIVQIGEWALWTACAQAMQWPSHIRVSVNLSTVQFRKPAQLLDAVTAALVNTGLDPRRLELEITESLLLEASGQTRAVLNQLRGMGISIALDDFGTGYSSLSYLQKFPFSRIKIDRSFVKKLGADGCSTEIVRAIVAMARALNMSVTAEGIETDQQLEIAVNAGCAELQGFLFSRPRPASEIATLFVAPSLAEAAA